MTFEPASSVLSDITVLDLTRVRAGPTCVRQLADWGANVIKIEMPATSDEGQLGGPRSGSDFQNLHRNKRAMSLNLKTEAGVKVFKELVKTADVVVENYRADVKHRLGIDYETLSAINPRLIYGSISGFGQDGPLAKRPGFDQIAQGMGGLMSITGAPGEGPMRVGIPVADLTSRHFLRPRHSARPDRAPEVRQGPVGANLAAAGPGLHARFPGIALADGRRGGQAGRQQPSNQHSNRRF